MPGLERVMAYVAGRSKFISGIIGYRRFCLWHPEGGTQALCCPPVCRGSREGNSRDREKYFSGGGAFADIFRYRDGSKY